MCIFLVLGCCVAADSGHLAFNRVPHCQVLDVDDSYSDIFGGEIICTCGCVCVCVCPCPYVFKYG